MFISWQWQRNETLSGGVNMEGGEATRVVPRPRSPASCFREATRDYEQWFQLLKENAIVFSVLDIVINVSLSLFLFT